MGIGTTAVPWDERACRCWCTPARICPIDRWCKSYGCLSPMGLFTQGLCNITDYRVESFALKMELAVRKDVHEAQNQNGKRETISWKRRVSLLILFLLVCWETEEYYFKPTHCSFHTILKSPLTKFSSQAILNSIFYTCLISPSKSDHNLPNYCPSLDTSIVTLQQVQLGLGTWPFSMISKEFIGSLTYNGWSF